MINPTANFQNQNHEGLANTTAQEVIGDVSQVSIQHTTPQHTTSKSSFMGFAMSVRGKKRMKQFLPAAFILFLVVAVVASSYLVSFSQDIRQQASEGYVSNPCHPNDPTRVIDGLFSGSVDFSVPCIVLDPVSGTNYTYWKCDVGYENFGGACLLHCNNGLVRSGSSNLCNVHPDSIPRSSDPYLRCIDSHTAQGLCTDEASCEFHCGHYKRPVTATPTPRPTPTPMLAPIPPGVGVPPSPTVAPVTTQPAPSQTVAPTATEAPRVFVPQCQNFEGKTVTSYDSVANATKYCETDFGLNYYRCDGNLVALDGVCILERPSLPECTRTSVARLIPGTSPCFLSASSTTAYQCDPGNTVIGPDACTPETNINSTSAGSNSLFGAGISGQ